MAYLRIFGALRDSSFSILTDVIFFLIGATLYGALTGAALTWGLRKKEGKTDQQRN
jgi:hypothetical protein